MPEAPDTPIRTRTVTSTILAVLMLLLIPVAAIPTVGILEMASRGHRVRDTDWLAGSILGVLWLLSGAIAFLRKAPRAAALVLPGLLGVAVGLIGIAAHAGGAIVHAGSSTGREELFILSITLLPLVAGAGHLVEARRRGARFFYVAAPLVAMAGMAASVR